jgi:anti-sigma factor ChrR (cupin superfamily)
VSDDQRPARLVVPAFDAAAFEPYDRYSQPVEGLSWVNVSWDAERSQGSFVLRFEPGASSLPHEHMGYEEFYLVEGELIDNDGTVFRAGDFVSFEPGTIHSSSSPGGCLIVVFMRGPNRLVDET